MNPTDNQQNIQPAFIPTNPLHWLNLDGFIQSTEVVPTAKPRSVKEQFVLVSGGGSTRAYLYDIAALAWKYVALT